MLLSGLLGVEAAAGDVVRASAGEPLLGASPTDETEAIKARGAAGVVEIRDRWVPETAVV